MAATDLISIGFGGSASAPIAYFSTFGLGDYGGAAPVVVPSAVPSQGGAGWRKRPSAAITPDELRAIWRGTVYVPAAPEPERDAEIAVAIQEAKTGRAPRTTLEEQVAAALRMKAEMWRPEERLPEIDYERVARQIWDAVERIRMKNDEEAAVLLMML